MKRKKLFIVPLVLIIIAISASIIAFVNSDKLEDGYLYVENNPQNVVFEGDYLGLVANLGSDSEFIQVVSLDDGVHISVYDYEEEYLKDYILIINEVGEPYSKAIISENENVSIMAIEEIDEYLFKAYLEKGKIYDLNIIEGLNNPSDDPVDVVLVNLPENILNMKSITESISFSSGVFALISLFTIFALIYVSKE